MPRRKKKHTGRKLLAIGAAALGTYYLYGAKEAKKNRVKAKAWMLKAKAEALEAVEKAKNIDEKDYQKIIDKVENKYKKIKNVDNKDLAVLLRELKKHYKDIVKKVSKSTVSARARRSGSNKSAK